MTNAPTVPARTSTQLLETLREATGETDLEYGEVPTPLSGGFYAELVRFRLAGAPPELSGDLVARIVPDEVAGAWEAAIQRRVADQGFPTPAVHLTAPASGPLGRFLIVMDLVDGRPPMAGLGLGRVVTQLPRLLRQLPVQLAEVAATLHALDPGPLAADLEALDGGIPTTTAGFVHVQGERAGAAGRGDLAEAAEALVESEPRSTARVIAHGDLHPFNLLVTPTGLALVDWTVARVAHPGFTVGFTALMLAHPPIPGPAALDPLLRPVGTALAGRFLRAYRDLTDGTPAEVDEANLDWHRKVHALRILVELALWDAAGQRPTAGHPWLIMEPVAERLLGLAG